MNAKQMWAAYTTIVRKEFLRLFRVWVQTLLPPAVTTVLYFLVFGKFIGSQVQPVNGVPYMAFIIPGVIMISVITQSFFHSAFGYYFAKFQKSLEEILVSPTPYFVMVTGYVTGGVLRGMVTGLILLVVSLFFAPFSIHHLGHLIAFALLASILFSLGGIINAVFANDFDTINIFPTFILTPLTYLAGTFYSLSMLPELWRDLSLWNPILYMINGFRYGLIGVTDVDLSLAYLILITLNGATAFFVWYLFKTGRGIRT